MTDLKEELASLRLDDEPRRRKRWPVVMLVLLVVAAAVGVYRWRTNPELNSLEVETVQAAVATSQQASAGSPILTASGYVVARRKAVVSAKIQGRLSALKVEEGSRVRKGQVLGVLQNLDQRSALANARAALSRVSAGDSEWHELWAEADSLAEVEGMLASIRLSL